MSEDVVNSSAMDVLAGFVKDALNGAYGQSVAFVVILIACVIITDKTVGFDRVEKWISVIFNYAVAIPLKTLNSMFVYVWNIFFRKKIEAAKDSESDKEDVADSEGMDDVLHNLMKDYNVDLSKGFGQLEMKMADIKNARTGDMVKDALLRDITESMYNAVVAEIQEFINSYSADQSVSQLLAKLQVSVNEIIRRYTYSWRKKKITPELISKISQIFEDEEAAHVATNEVYNRYDNNPIRVATDLDYICAHYTAIIGMFENQIKTMNGTLNGVEYNKKIIGMYSSSGNLKIDRFPLPLGVYDSDVSAEMRRIKDAIGCDYVGLIDIYETPDPEDDTIESRIKVIHDSKFALTYTNAPKKFAYNVYLNKLVKDLFSLDEVRRLVSNEIIICNRKEMYEWSNVRKFMAVNEASTIIFQPVLSGKEYLIGVAVYLYIDYKDRSKDEADKEILHNKSARLVGFLRHNIP